LADPAKSFFSLISLWKRIGKKCREKVYPEAAGEFQEGVDAPVASRREPAGTTKGGDNLPRRCRTRGEATP
jgi:hypothetical protein